MGVIEAVEQRLDEVDHALARQGTGHHVVQARAARELEHHELRVLVRADIEHTDDILVLEASGDGRFSAKPRQHRRIVEQVIVKDLDRDVAPQLDVGAAIHGPHRAFANSRLDHVSVEHDLADQLRHWLGLGLADAEPGARISLALTTLIVLGGHPTIVNLLARPQLAPCGEITRRRG